MGDPVTTFLVLGSIGTGVQIHAALEQRKAAKRSAAAQREANRVQRRIADVRANREQRARIARMRAAQASAINIAGVEGGLGGSQVAGVVAGQRSVTAGNVGFSQFTQGANNEISVFNQQAADAQSQVLQAQALGQLGGAIANLGSIFPSSQGGGGGSSGTPDAMGLEGGK